MTNGFKKKIAVLLSLFHEEGRQRKGHDGQTAEGKEGKDDELASDEDEESTARIWSWIRRKKRRLNLWGTRWTRIIVNLMKIKIGRYALFFS
jgi:hypothetical protein